MEGIEYPVKLSQIAKFEKQNKDIAVNVSHVNEYGKLVVLRACPEERLHCVNLLLLKETVIVSPDGSEQVVRDTSVRDGDNVVHRFHYKPLKKPLKPFKSPCLSF